MAAKYTICEKNPHYQVNNTNNMVVESQIQNVIVLK